MLNQCLSNLNVTQWLLKQISVSVDSSENVLALNRKMSLISLAL